MASLGNSRAPHASAGSDFHDVCGAVLAGGASRRMGVRKAALRVDGLPLIERVVSTLGGVFTHNLIVVNRPDLHGELGLPTVTDIHGGCGSLGGIHAALSHAPRTHVFCVACDMPFLNAEVIRYLVEKRGRHDVVVPVLSGRAEPLHALYRKSCLPVIERSIDKGELAINRLFKALDVLEVGADEMRVFDGQLLSFANCNTPDELARLRQLARQRAVGSLERATGQGLSGGG